MFDTERLPVDKPSTPETAAGPVAAGRPALGLWAAAGLLGLLILISRLLGDGDVAHQMTNLAALKGAMQAVAGLPVPDALPFATAEAVSGLQARSLSLVAQVADQRATAEVWLRRGLSDPRSAYLSQFELCRLYWNEGRRDDAREACRGTRASAVYWLEQGYVADQNGERDEALAFFEMAAATDPELVAAWQQAGHTLLALKRYEGAITAYERVLVLDQSPAADVIHSLGRAYLEVGNPTLARDVLNRGLLIYPNQRELYLVMAETYRREGDRATADGWYGRILQRWPYDAQTWANRGEVAAADGRWLDAVDFLQEATANQPADVGYWLALADAATAADHVPLATDAYRQAMALRPDEPSIWLRAGRFLADTNQPDEARAALEHVLAAQPDHDEAAALLAALEQSSGE